MAEYSQGSEECTKDYRGGAENGCGKGGVNGAYSTKATALNALVSYLVGFQAHVVALYIAVHSLHMNHELDNTFVDHI